MKILLFPTRFYPAISGGDFYLERLGRELKKTSLGSNDVFYISSDALDFGALHGNGKTINPNHRNFSSYNNLKVMRFHCHNPTNLEEGTDKLISEFISLCIKELKISSEILLSIINNGPFLPELIHWLLEEQTELIPTFYPEIIHCSYLPYNTLLYTLLIGKKYGIPTIVTPFLHDSNTRYQSKGIYSILNNFSTICACTNYEKDNMVHNGISSDKIVVLPMGVDFDKFQPDYRNLFQNSYNLSGPLVLFCGYKNYEKGALSLLNAIPIVLKKIPLVNFMFIGPSTTAFNYSLKKLKKKIVNLNVKNFTPENQSSIYDKIKIGAFQQASVFCMVSRSDAYGIVYLESWSCETPIIAANTGPMYEVVENNHDGILVEFDNIQNISEAICKLLNDPLLIKKMGEAGKSKVEKNNKWNNIASSTLIIYQKLIKRV